MVSGWANLTATGNASGKTILAKKERCFRLFMVSLFFFVFTMFWMFHECQLPLFMFPYCHRLPSLSEWRSRKCAGLLVALRKGFPDLKYPSFEIFEIFNFRKMWFCFGFHVLEIPQPHNISGGRAANGWIWFLLWGRKNETDRQAKLLWICITKKNTKSV